MSRFTALFDACVLYPASMRDFLMHLAVEKLFRARWSDAIHEEWIGSLLRNRPDLTRERLERTRDKMNAAVLDSVVTGYESLIPSLILPDPNDRHVLAAAIKGKADVIVTLNLDDFPRDYLAEFDLEPLHPDEFAVCQFDLARGSVCAAVRRLRESLSRPRRSPQEYLDSLARAGLVQTAARLTEYIDVI